MSKPLGKFSKKMGTVLGALALTVLFVVGSLSVSAVNQPSRTASVIAESVHFTGVQTTLKWLYGNAGNQVNYLINGVEVFSTISNVVNYSVSVNFVTTFGSMNIDSSGIIYKDRGNYYIVDADNASENSSNSSASDPGGNYYYYVTSAGTGSGSQT